MGEFTVVPDNNGEKVAPLEDPVPPPPPPEPPPPTIEPEAEARCDPEDGVCALNFGEDRDCPDCWCCCEPDWKEVKGEGVEAGEGAFRPGWPLAELRTAEKEEVRGEEEAPPGPGLLDWGTPREDAEGSDDEARLLVASGVSPRRAKDWDTDGPQADCCDLPGLVEEDLSVPEAIDDWEEG